jgi:hypothetical protein
MNFQKSSDVLESLISIFPEFRSEWENENPYIKEDGSHSIHSVYMVLLGYVSARKSSFNSKQFKQLATLINGAVAAGGNSENAISTCFLEHADQVGLSSALKPLLEREAKKQLSP